MPDHYKRHIVNCRETESQLTRQNESLRSRLDIATERLRNALSKEEVIEKKDSDLDDVTAKCEYEKLVLEKEVLKLKNELLIAQRAAENAEEMVKKTEMAGRMREKNNMMKLFFGLLGLIITIVAVIVMKV